MSKRLVERTDCMKAGKRFLFYGIGKRFEQLFLRDLTLTNKMNEYNFEVIGFMDGSNDKLNMPILYNGNTYLVKSKEECVNMDYDYLVVATSDKFYLEIKSELINECNYNGDRIIPIDEFIGIVIFKTGNINYGAGIEIGGPSSIFVPIYKCCKSCDGVNFNSNTIWWDKPENDIYCYGENKLGKVYIADAVNMNIIDDCRYDFILSSNNLEHIANPMKALGEFCRLAKKGGVVIVVVPMKDRTFDHCREYTSFEHIMSDYDNNIAEDDLSHLPEILELHDYDLDLPCGGREKFKERALHNAENRCLHQHVFNKECLMKMFEYLNLEVLDFMEYLNNYLIMGRKR
jgi:SAM-dependent methyltransferase